MRKGDIHWSLVMKETTTAATAVMEDIRCKSEWNMHDTLSKGEIRDPTKIIRSVHSPLGPLPVKRYVSDFEHSEILCTAYYRANSLP